MNTSLKHQKIINDLKEKGTSSLGLEQALTILLVLFFHAICKKIALDVF